MSLIKITTFFTCITAATAVAGKCGGNAATATDLAEASTPAGTFQFACGTGFTLKATPATIALGTGDAAAKKATCCSAKKATAATCSTIATTAGFCGAGKTYDDGKKLSSCAASACAKATAADVAACCKPDFSYVCTDPTKYVGGHTYKVGELTIKCDTTMALLTSKIAGKDQALYGIDFSKKYDCTGKSTEISNNIKTAASSTMGCCGVAGKSTCDVASANFANLCADPTLYVGSHEKEAGSGVTCDAVMEVSTTTDGALAGEDFSVAYKCGDKDSLIQHYVDLMATDGCCGTGSSACHAALNSAKMSTLSVGVAAVGFLVAAIVGL